MLLVFQNAAILTCKKIKEFWLFFLDHLVQSTESMKLNTNNMYCS